MQKLSINESWKKKIHHFTQNQQKNNLEKQEAGTTNIYKCYKCRDRTFVLKDDVAYPCECRNIRLAESILEASGISKEFRNKNFDSFDYGVNVQSVDAYNKARDYCDDFDRIKDLRRNSIIFMGAAGSGKTHLSLAIANKLMIDGISVIYMSYRDIITQIKQSILDEESYRKIMDRYKNAKVLLIDDLFKGNITKSDINVMFEILNHRYFNNMPIIVSTEKTMNELIAIDEAIGSRIVEMCKDNLVEFRGRMLNYRLYGN